MPHGGMQVQGAQRANPANSQYHFLLQAHFPVAAVELVCYSAIRLGVIGYVGVEQVQAYMAGPGGPHTNLENTVWKFQVQCQMLPGLGQGGNHWQVVRV